MNLIDTRLCLDTLHNKIIEISNLNVYGAVGSGTKIVNSKIL